MNEEWKPIKNYEGVYIINNRGVVITLPKNLIRKQHFDKDYYYKIVLYKDRILKSFQIHRLVAQAFIQNPENKPQVNHINGIKTDNRVENLEWVTISENMKHAFDTGLMKNNNFINNHPMKGKFGKDHTCSIKVDQYSKEGEFIKTWDCMTDAQIDLGVFQSGISKCCHGKGNTAGGFIWKFNIK